MVMDDIQSPSLDPQRQQKAREYARLSRRLMLYELCGDAGFILVWLLLGWSKALKIFIQQYSRDEWLTVAGFMLIFGAVYSVLDLPFTYYNGYILPKRYEISTQSLKEWVVDELKGMALTIPLGLLLLEIVYAVLRSAPDTWWLWAAGIMLIFNVLLANLAPILIAPLFNKYIPLGEEHAELEQRLLKLAEKAGTHVRGVYKFDMSRRTKAANAGLTGLGNSRRIILGDTLINEFSADEIETVLAHELGHQVNHDIPLGIAFGTLVTLAGFYLAGQGLALGVKLFGFTGVGDIAALPLFALVMGCFGLVTMPLTNAFSRWREWRADSYALQITGKGEEFASALVRLANQNLAEAEPEAWVEFLLHSHPALSKRIANARAVGIH